MGPVYRSLHTSISIITHRYVDQGHLSYFKNPRRPVCLSCDWYIGETRNKNFNNGFRVRSCNNLTLDTCIFTSIEPLDFHVHGRFHVLFMVHIFTWGFNFCSCSKLICLGIGITVPYRSGFYLKNCYCH